MRIVVLGTRGFPNVQGGVESHCQNLYPLLVQKGCEVIILARAAYVGEKEYTYEGVRIIPLFCLRNKHLESFLHTLMGVFVAPKFKPDILHIHSIGPGFFAVLSRILGMRVVLTTHGENYRHLKWGVFARLFLRLCEFLAALSANKIIAVSRYIAGELERKYKRVSIVIPNGVKRIEPASTDVALQKFGLTKGKYFIAVGRLVPEKGIHDLVEAYAFLQHPEWKLVVVGDSDHDDVYSRNIKSRGKALPGVVITGFLSGGALREVFSHAGAFVLPSYYEGAPIALLEAMSYGLNCLVSDIPATREMHLPERQYTPVGEVGALSVKLQAFMECSWTDLERSAQMDRVAKDYDWGFIADKTLLVYQESMLKE